jgi:hypothetical protein
MSNISPGQVVTVRLNLKNESMGIDDGDDHHVIERVDCLDSADFKLLERGVTRTEEWHEEYPAEFIAGAVQFGVPS